MRPFRAVFLGGVLNVATAEYYNYPPELQEQYQRDLVVYRDNYAAFKTAIDDGYGVGLAVYKAECEAKSKTDIAVK